MVLGYPIGINLSIDSFTCAASMEKYTISFDYSLLPSHTPSDSLSIPIPHRFT